MMKVLYVSHDTAMNGAPKSMLEYLAVIKNKNVIPVVVIPDKGPLKEELDGNNIKNFVVPYFRCIYTEFENHRNELRYISSNIQAISKIIKIIKEEKIDIVHSNSFAVDVGAMAAYLAGVPHVWHLREYLEEDFNFKLVTPRLARCLISKSDCCIAISKGIQIKYGRKYGRKSVLLYNGIDSSKYYSTVKCQNSSETLTKEIMIAGTISEGKGQWDAIRAVEILANRGIKVHLNIVGKGMPEYVNKLKKYVRIRKLKENITFIKYTKDLCDLRNKSSMILVCSRMEAFGRVTAEAMMSGKIVVGANSGGTLELIGKEEERGYLYEFNNVENLAQKIEYVLENQEEVREKEIIAQEYILKLTDIEKYTDNLLRIYKKIIG